MAKTRMLLLGGLAIVAVAVGTVAVRTANFAPANLADGSDVTLAAAPAYDLDAAVRHLSAAAQIRTISHQNPTDNESAEWDRLHAWLASTYPAAHAAMTRTILPNRTSSEERRVAQECVSKCSSQCTRHRSNTNK